MTPRVNVDGEKRSKNVQNTFWKSQKGDWEGETRKQEANQVNVISWENCVKKDVCEGWGSDQLRLVPCES